MFVHAIRGITALLLTATDEFFDKDVDCYESDKHGCLSCRL